MKVEEIQASTDARQLNQMRKTNKAVDECFVCGWGLTQAAVDKAWFIEMTFGGELIAADDRRDREDSQGCFPLGSECAKRVPKEFRIKIQR